jgi:peptide/nickel transport system permease protein
VATLGRRLLSLAVVLFVVSLGCFLLVDRLPGGPEVAILGPAATAETLAQVRSDLHLDDPFVVRYGRWLGDALQGDFGRSYELGQPVGEVLRRRVPATLQLVLGAQVLAVALAVPIALLAGARPGGRVDRLLARVCFAFVTVPSFAVGLVLQYVFAERLRWLPASQYTPFGQDPVENVRSLVLPVVTLALGQAAVYARVLQAELVSTLEQDFVLLARAKGLGRRQVLVRHALRPSSLTLVTLLGLNFGLLLSGSLVVERIFSIPGLGGLVTGSLPTRDFTTLQGAVVVLAVAFVAANFLVDVVYAALDPRIRRPGRR